MRIIKYSTLLDENKKTVLVKEDSNNYPSVDNLSSPEKIVDVLNHAYKANRQTEEHTWLVALTTKCKPIGLFEISHGTVNLSPVSPREIFVKLCLCGAACFVIAHNHPSGDTTPSSQDIATTNNIAKVGEMMGIELLDHIIIGDNFYSFKEHNGL